MLISKEVKVKWNYKTKDWFISKGYKFTKNNDVFIAKVEDLPPNGVNSLVTVSCDYCGIIYEIKHNSYVIRVSKIPKVCCGNVECMKLKRVESNVFKYGVGCLTQLPSVIEKMKQTNIERFGTEYAISAKDTKDKIKKTFKDKYGVDNCFQIEDVKNKSRETTLEKYGSEWYTQTDEYKERVAITNMDKYGCVNVFENEDIKQKSKETMIEKYGCLYSATQERKDILIATCNERYGVDNPFQLESVKETIIKYNIKRYGVTHPMKNPIIKKARIEKMLKTKHRNGTGQSSRQQDYLHMVLGGEINYPVNFCSLDVAFLDEMIFIEFDGSGHRLSVQFGDISETDFNRKEMKRKYFLLSKGWKEIRIISLHDNLPLEDKLFKMKKLAMEYLNSGHTWIKFDIDNNKIICSQYEKEYNYGNLRKIKEIDLIEVV